MKKIKLMKSNLNMVIT